MDVVGILGGFDTLDIGIEMEVDPFSLHFRTGELAHLLIKAFQKELAPVNQVCLAAEPIKDAGKLNGDITAPQDEKAFGKGIQIENLVGV